MMKCVKVFSQEWRHSLSSVYSSYVLFGHAIRESKGVMKFCRGLTTKLARSNATCLSALKSIKNF